MSDQATALNAMRVIDLVLDFGPDGEHWLQGAFRDRRKRRCLVDAIAYVRRKHGISGDDASWYIYEVIRPQIYEVRPGEFWRPSASAKSLWSESQLRDRLMSYNDSHCKSFAELRAVLIKARSRAECCHAAARRALDRQAEINAPKAAAEQKRRAAVEARWNLITQVQYERKSSAVRRITRHTYILCPRVPEPQPEPLRLAA